MRHQCSDGDTCLRPAAGSLSAPVFSLFIGDGLSGARLVFDDVLAAVRSAGVDTQLRVAPPTADEVLPFLDRVRRHRSSLIVGSAAEPDVLLAALTPPADGPGLAAAGRLPAVLIVGSRWPGLLFRLIARPALARIYAMLARHGFRVVRLIPVRESRAGLAEPGPFTRAWASMAGQRMAAKWLQRRD